MIVEEEADLPEALGEVAEYPDAAVVEHGKVVIESLKQVDDLLIGRIRVSPNGEELSREAIRVYKLGHTNTVGARDWSLDESYGYRGSTLYNVTLLHDSQRYYPIDYYLTPLPNSEAESQLSEEPETDYIVPLAERFLPDSGELYDTPEESYFTATVIWPAVDAEEAAIELGVPKIPIQSGGEEANAEAVHPWRITNVQIEKSSTNPAATTTEN